MVVPWYVCTCLWLWQWQICCLVQLGCFPWYYSWCLLVPRLVGTLVVPSTSCCMVVLCAASVRYQDFVRSWHLWHSIHPTGVGALAGPSVWWLSTCPRHRGQSVLVRHQHRGSCDKLSCRCRGCRVISKQCSHQSTLSRGEHPAGKCRSRGGGRHPWSGRLLLWRWLSLCDLLAAAVLPRRIALPRGNTFWNSIIIRNLVTSSYPNSLD